MTEPPAIMAPLRYGLGRAAMLVFCPFAAGYFLSYLYRSANAVIAPQLTVEIGLDAGDLGLLTSVYFLTFAAFQLPLGVLLDRYGPRRVQSALLLVAAAGAGLFAVGGDKYALAVGRGLIGLGVAGGLMASLKAGTIWFDRRHWPIVNGFFLGVGGAGAMAATAPLEAVLQAVDWRGVFLGLAAVTALVSAWIFFAVPESQTGRSSGSLRSQIRQIGVICAHPRFWRLAPLAMTAFAANLSIQGLWAGPWLRDVGGFDRDGVAFGLLMLAGSLAVGSVLIGMLTGLTERFGVPLLAFMGAGVLLFFGFQAAIVLELAPRALWPWIGFGLLSNIAILSYVDLARRFPADLYGRVSTTFNVFMFAGTFLAQYLIGEVIDLWPALPGGQYRPAAYFGAFGLLLAVQCACFLWFLVPSGSDCRPSPAPDHGG